MTVLITIQLKSRPGHLFPDVTIDADVRSAPGRVLEITRKASAKGRQSDTFRIDFIFRDEQQVEHEGYSYAKRFRIPAEEHVTIEYSASEPWLSRVSGSHAAGIHAAVFIVPVLKLWIGLGLLWYAFASIAIRKKLLREGTLATGNITEVDHNTSVKVNGMSPWRIRYVFEDKEGVAGSGTIMTFPKTRLSTEPPAEIGTPCVVLYDRNQPERNTLVMEGDFP
ncbi:DUF3592 domain-containing protein [Acanthopleuribacter pedis]|uniref:DUF3592 domain-containing protein n=1 Tax=Acanthopleuribacter pedis TaxID=442870 RepID=A0A8J7QPF6_9BACT|nr:DUF3592 domain-containing protein [Acanthopleuribacter pedis]MBO1321700.1 hypothetical protein [Acanthopleuribacter pedis]